MARQSSVEAHPEREAILAAIANGMSGAEVARKFSLSESAVSRWKSSARFSLIQILAEEGNDPTELLGRYLDLSDSARQATKLANTSGSVQVRAKAIATELSVLDRLAKLGLDDTAVARMAQATGPLVKAIQKLSQTYPTEVLEVLATFPELADLKDALRAQNRKTA